MDLSALARALPSLCALALVGRTALALLPPGWPGGHGARELAATWAASHLLGVGLVALEHALARAAGVEVRALLLVAPWLAVALARAALLPAAMLPRHEPARERPGRGTRALGAAGALLLAASVVAGGAAAGPLGARAAEALGSDAAGAWIQGAGFAAAACLAVAGLERGRRAPAARAAALALLGTCAWAARGGAGGVEAPLLIAGAAGVAVAWLRRADARARALAGVLGAAPALAGGAGWAWGGVGLAGLALASPRAGRKPALAWALPVLLVGALAGAGSGSASALRMPSGSELAVAALVLGTTLGVAWLRLRRTRASRKLPPDPERPDEPGRELAGAALWLGAACALAASGPDARERSAPTLLALAPLAALFVGLLAAPSERPGRAS